MPVLFARRVCVCLLLVAACGCGDSSERVPVTGTVKLDGKPLANATVQFIAQDPGGRDAFGSTNADGVFHLSTLNPNDGALRGKYKVTIQRASEAPKGLPVLTIADAQKGSKTKLPPPNTLPGRYSRADQTILTQEVPATGDIVFELQSK